MISLTTYRKRHRQTKGKQMTKTQVISLRILTLVAEGMDVRQALDTVCGAGTSEKMISDLYDNLRAKAGK